MRAETRSRALLAALSALLAALVAVATRALVPAGALAFALCIEAILVALAAPLAAVRPVEKGEPARAPLGALGALGAFAAVLLFVAIVREGDVVGLLLAQLYLLLQGAALYGLARAAAVRGGVGAGLAVGLGAGFFLLGAPYFLGDAVAALPGGEDFALSALLHFSPSLALPGTFLGRDPFHDTVLYHTFTVASDRTWRYASAPAALLAQAVFAGLALGAGALAARLPRRTPAALAGFAAALFLLAPAQAHAQIFGGGDGTVNPEVPEGEIGPMNTRVRLGYIVPFIDGNFKVTGVTPDLGTRLSLDKDLDLTLQYAVPVFEVDIGWQGAGRVWLEYWEFFFKGDFAAPQPFGAIFKNLTIPAGEGAVVDYNFRTISFNGRLDIPVFDFATLEIIATTRYVHWDTEARIPRTGQKDRTTVDAIFPAIGPGADIFVFDKVYVYGSIQWLDITIGVGKTYVYRYREVHAGVRLELVDAAHVGAEFYLLEVTYGSSRRSYRQNIIGPRIWVEVQF